MSDIEGKAAREAVSECGQRANFNLGEGGLEIFDDLKLVRFPRSRFHPRH
jgi:hypothetical protein